MADVHHTNTHPHTHTDSAPEDATDLVEASIGVLRERGERVTTPRRLVIEELAATTGHLSADDLLDRITARSPGVHLATVYRTLEALEHAGIAAHVHLPHGATTYHLVRSGHPAHLHLMCRGCDRLIDVAADTLDQVADGLERSHGFQLDPHHVALTGWCRDCAPTSG